MPPDAPAPAVSVVPAAPPGPPGTGPIQSVPLRQEVVIPADATKRARREAAVAAAQRAKAEPKEVPKKQAGTLPTPKFREPAKPPANPLGSDPAARAATPASAMEVQAAPQDAPPLAEVITPEPPAQTEKKSMLDSNEQELWKRIHQGRKRQARAIREANESRQRIESERANERAIRDAEERADSQLKANDRQAWLAKHGFDFLQVAKEAVAKKDETPEQKELRELREWRAQKDRELSELQAVRAEQADRQVVEQAHRQTVHEFEADKTRYPTLSAYYTPSEVAEAVTAVRIEFYERNKRQLPIERALRFVEGNAKSARDRFKAERATAASQEANPGTANGASAARATAAPQGAKTRAAGRPVTNQDAAHATAPPAPLTAEERRANALKIAGAMWRK